MSGRRWFLILNHQSNTQLIMFYVFLFYLKVISLYQTKKIILGLLFQDELFIQIRYIIG